MHVKVQEFSEVCQEGKLDQLREPDSSRLGQEERSNQVDWVLKTAQGLMWKAVPREMGEYFEPLSEKR